jgi:hypothetical protein
MRHLVHHLSTICVSILLASFSVNKLCVLHSAYQLQRTKIEKEAWLRAQCAKPEFYTNMRYHNTLCEEVEATARIGALWHALQEVAAGIPAADALALVQRLSWPLLLALALACLCLPSAFISHMRCRHDRLPLYEGKHAA